MAENKYHFERLTPIDNMDLDVYEEAIDYVFNNPDVKNVAISGAYSAGKSSVLASYKKRHNDLRFLHISLAHFKSPDQEDETEVKESVLEGKILNQLIHQIPSEKIPQTNFRVKKKVSTKSVIKLTIGVVLFFIVAIYFACFDIWKNYVSTLTDNWFKSILALYRRELRRAFRPYGQAENAVPRHRQSERGQRRDPHERRGASGVCGLSEPCPPNGGHGATAYLLLRTYRRRGLPQKNQSALM